MKTIVFCLGRFGDAINALPLAYCEAHKGEVGFCISYEFANVLAGASYVTPLVWPGSYNDPLPALKWLRTLYPRASIINVQAYRHPTDKQRLTPSYQMESWRVAGRLSEFGMWPTVFDRRSPEREDVLHIRNDKPTILVALESVSSPLKQRRELLEAIQTEFGGDCYVVDLAGLKCSRIFDLLGVFDRSACLVTADTSHLHLARASKIPVVALISEGNVGKPVNWFGSIPPPNTIASFRYSSLSAQLTPVLEAIERVIKPSACREVVHVVDNHGETERHQRARETWSAAGDGSNVLGCYKTSWPQRGESFLRDVLETALKCTARDDEAIIWSNSDTSFAPGEFSRIREHVQLWGACSIRRKETDGRTGVHMGRDVFAFRTDWLREHVSEIPDFKQAHCQFDLILAALIRRHRNVPTNKENLHLDIFPCEMSPGGVLHEPHESSWAGAEENTRPGNVWNKTLAREWCAMNCPTLSL